MRENNIKIHLPIEQSNKQTQYTKFSGQFFIASIFYVISSLAFLDAFKFPNISYYSLISGIIILSFLFFMQNKKIKTYAGLGSLLLITLVFIIFNKYTVNGLFLSLNHFAEVVGSKTTYLLPQYKILIEPESYQLAINFFMMYVFMLGSYLSYLIVSKGLAIIIWPLMILTIVIELITGIYFNIYLNVGLFLASLLILNTSFINKDSKTIHLNKTKNNPSFITGLMLISIVTLTLLISFAALPKADYEKNASINKLKEKTEIKVDSLRYGENAPDSFTQGDFLNLADLKSTNNIALEVIMEKPETYYLRGFVGADYSRKAWSNLKNETIYDSHGLFLSLEKTGFTPLTQLSIVDELTDKEASEKTPLEMTINNINAYSKYLYTPYEIKDSLIDLTDLHYFRENQLISTELKGKRQYSYEVSEDLVTRYPAIANRLYKSKDKKLVKAYLEQEAYYNQYVYDHYTQLPEEVENILGLHFGPKNETESHLAYEQAIEQVKDYLAETIEYNDTPKKLNRDRDFLSFIIEESREGYAPHYATTGTLLFRYLGIPARYVEGYLVTPDIIKNKKPFDKIAITGKEAHAWTEIYFDEIGWIPIEVTPEYEDIMPPTDMTDYPKGEWSDEEEKLQREKDKEKNEAIEEELDEPEVEEVEDGAYPESNIDEENKNNNGNDSEMNEDNNDVLTEDLEEDQPKLFKIILIIILIILLLLILIYLIYFIKKRLELRKLTRAFNGSNLNTATTLLTSYMLLLLHNAGVKERGGSIKQYEKDVSKLYGSEFASEFKRVLKINEAAVYSGKQTAEADHLFVLEYKDKLLAELLKEKTFIQKIKMRIWDFVY